MLLKPDEQCPIGHEAVCMNSSSCKRVVAAVSGGDGDVMWQY